MDNLIQELYSYVSIANFLAIVLMITFHDYLPFFIFLVTRSHQDSNKTSDLFIIAALEIVRSVGTVF